jgi:hypothetical protein
MAKDLQLSSCNERTSLTVRSLTRRSTVYVAQSRFPKWLGIALGGMFAVIFAGTAVIIVQLTRATAPVAVAAAPALAPAAATPTPTATAAAATAAQPEAAVAAASDEAPAPAPAKAGSKRHHASKRVAKRPAGISDAKAKAILARHDTKAKARQRDALDKLLGL